MGRSAHIFIHTEDMLLEYAQRAGDRVLTLKMADEDPDAAPIASQSPNSYPFARGPDDWQHNVNAP